MNEIQDGLNLIEVTHGSSDQFSNFEKTMKQREKETSKSFDDTMVIVHKAIEAFTKLKEITNHLFEGEEVYVPNEK